MVLFIKDVLNAVKNLKFKLKPGHSSQQVPQNDTKSSSLEQSQTNIEDQKIPLSRSFFIPAVKLVGLCSVCIVVTYSITNLFIIKPYQETIKNLSEEPNPQIKILTDNVNTLRENYNALLRVAKEPFLLNPKEGGNLIGDFITFEWDYNDQDINTNYILELNSIGQNPSKPYTYNVSREQKKRTVQISNISNGEGGESPHVSQRQFFWRIVPGYDGEYKGKPSPYSSFVVYPSNMDRIKITGKLNIGFTLEFPNVFEAKDKNDATKIIGFDIDLIEWIAEKLAQQLNIPLEVKYNEMSWDKLLDKLQEREIDLVISTMTATKKREINGIKFTEPYHKSHHIFFSKEQQGTPAFPNGLKGKKVATSTGICRDVAKHLEKKFGFEIDPNFGSDSDVLQAVIYNKVDYGLVGEYFAFSHLGKQIHQYGPNLDPHLGKFYKDEFGRDHEYLAIAVFEENLKEDNLLTLINRILTSEEGKQKLQDLTEKWIPASPSIPSS